jgi:hypothetical protein
MSWDEADVSIETVDRSKKTRQHAVSKSQETYPVTLYDLPEESKILANI